MAAPIGLQGTFTGDDLRRIADGGGADRWRPGCKPFFPAAAIARAEPGRKYLASLRDTLLSNRVFKGDDDIVSNCCDAWNGLMDQPRRIRSIGRRAWAEGS